MLRKTHRKRDFYSNNSPGAKANAVVITVISAALAAVIAFKASRAGNEGTAACIRRGLAAAAAAASVAAAILEATTRAGDIAAVASHACRTQQQV
jgi:hypothetical protein